MTYEPRVRTMSAAAAEMLRNEILSGRLPAGSRIPLSETASRLEMSAIPVREALQTLTSQGLVEQLPHRGYRVLGAGRRDLEDTYRLRLILDPLAVLLAVPNLTDANVEALERAAEALAKAQELDDWDAHRRHHTAFHFGIYEMSGSPWLLRFLHMLWDSSERYQKMSKGRRGSLEERVREHRLVLEAVRSGNAEEAARAMRDHLNRTYEVVSQRVIDWVSQDGSSDTTG